MTEQNKTQIAYKVIYHHRLNDTLKSAIDGNECSITYKVNEWIESEFPMFAFKDLNSAKIFAHGSFNVIFMAEVELAKEKEGIRFHPKRILSTFSLYENVIRDFWELRWYRDSEWYPPDYRTMPTPDGTIFCSRVKLLEQV